MKSIQVSDLIPAEEYLRVRDDYRRRLQQIKDRRRVLVGPYLNFMFENRDTMLYQIQEMIRAEGLKEEAAIRHEVETYNELVPGRHELKATLLIEIDNPQARAFKLRELVGLESQISLLIDRDFQIQASYDQRQVDAEKISSVQFLTFALGEQAAEAALNGDGIEILTSHPACSYRVALAPEQLAALREDLRQAQD